MPSGSSEHPGRAASPDGRPGADGPAPAPAGVSRLRSPYRPQDDAGITGLVRTASRARVVTLGGVVALAVAAGLLLPRTAVAEAATPTRGFAVSDAAVESVSDAAAPVVRVAVVEVDPTDAAPAPSVAAPAPTAPTAPAAAPTTTPTTTPPTDPAPGASTPTTAPAGTAPSTGLTEAQKAQRKAERKAHRKAERKAQRKAERKAQRKAERKAQRKAERKAERKAQRRAARSSVDLTMTSAARSSRAARERVSLADWRASDHARMIVWRESNGRCDVVSSNGLWRGCWQMTMTLWRANGGLQYASSPDRASCAEQDRVAYRVWLSAWWGPWGG